ncbi:MAG: hypothetical protein PHQ35_11075 [Phycisphaerae bacterium]|nr:hypothetical protein [Phycisphaerae bacterium]
MKERPILFSTEMIPSILRDEKTHTRRVIKPQPSDGGLDWIEWEGFSAWQDPMRTLEEGCQRICPYGQLRDRLWVKETYRAEELADDTTEGQPGLDGIRYKADGFFRPIENSREAADRWIDARGEKSGIWRSSMFMPRWASRITLEILGIEVRRLQDITEEAAIQEGVEIDVIDQAPIAKNYLDKNNWFQEWDPDITGMTFIENGEIARASFTTLWNSLNAKPTRAARNPYTGKREDCYVSYPWDDIREEREKAGLVWYVVGNPWVWDVWFKRMEE